MMIMIIVMSVRTLVLYATECRMSSRVNTLFVGFVGILGAGEADIILWGR